MHIYICVLENYSPWTTNEYACIFAELSNLGYERRYAPHTNDA